MQTAVVVENDASNKKISVRPYDLKEQPPPPLKLDAIVVLRDFERFPYISRDERRQIADMLEEYRTALKGYLEDSIV